MRTARMRACHAALYRAQVKVQITVGANRENRTRRRVQLPKDMSLAMWSAVSRPVRVMVSRRKGAAKRETNIVKMTNDLRNNIFKRTKNKKIMSHKAERGTSCDRTQLYKAIWMKYCQCWVHSKEIYQSLSKPLRLLCGRYGRVNIYLSHSFNRHIGIFVWMKFSRRKIVAIDRVCLSFYVYAYTHTTSCRCHSHSHPHAVVVKLLDTITAKRQKSRRKNVRVLFVSLWHCLRRVIFCWFVWKYLRPRVLMIKLHKYLVEPIRQTGYIKQTLFASDNWRSGTCACFEWYWHGAGNLYGTTPGICMNLHNTHRMNGREYWRCFFVWRILRPGWWIDAVTVGDLSPSPPPPTAGRESECVGREGSLAFTLAFSWWWKVLDTISSPRLFKFITFHLIYLSADVYFIRICDL